MAHDDDDDLTDGPPRGSEGGPLESWADLSVDTARARVTRSWSQIAALDEGGASQRPDPADGERPEGLLTVDSGLLDLMEQEAGGALPADFDPDTADAGTGASGALPADFDPDTVDIGGSVPDVGPGAFDFGEALGGMLPDDLDEPATIGGALPDDFDFDLDDDPIGGASGGALPGELGLDHIVREDAALDDDPFGDPAGALPDDLDFDLDAPIGAPAGLLGDAAALPDDFDLPDFDDEPIGGDDGSMGTLPGETDFGDAAVDALGGFDPLGDLGDLDDLDDLDGPGGLDELDELGPLGADAGLGGALPDGLDVDGLTELEGLIGSAPDAGEIDPDADLGDPAESVDLGFGGDVAIGAEDDWLEAVLDEVDGRPIGDDADWGELLDEDEPAGAGTSATIAPRSSAGPVEDLWSTVAADWGDEPAGGAPAAMPFEDPFAAPVRGGLADETDRLGDPFERAPRAPARPTATAPMPTPDEAGGAEGDWDEADDWRDEEPARAEADVETAPPAAAPAPGDTADDGPRPPTPAQIEAALALLMRRSAARRAERVADADDPEVMIVEEPLEDGPERRVVRVEYPRLGELEILELPEDGAELPGLDDDFDAFGHDYVFFEGDAFDSHATEGPPGDRRSALAALSREPVELARLLGPAGASAEAAPGASTGPGSTLDAAGSTADEPGLAVQPAAGRAPALADDSTETALALALDAATRDSVDLAPQGPIDDALAALGVEPVGDVVLPLADLRPGWAGPAFEPDLVDRLGAPFLGVIPPFGGRPAVGQFPPGSLARGRGVGAGPAVLPRLVTPSVAPEAETWAHRLVRFLIAEAGAESSRARLAALLHGLGVVARRPLGDERLALDALRGAAENDPGLPLNRWALFALLDEAGLYDEVIERLVRPDAAGRVDPDGLYRAGHVARVAARDEAEALARWDAADADGPHAPSRLAAYLLRVGGPDAGAVSEALDALLDAAEGPIWWSALALDRVRRGAERAPSAEQLLEEAIRRRGGVPGVFAAVERHALTRGQMSLWLSALRARFDRVMADYEGGALEEGAAQRELAEVFVKAGLALETLGRRAEALAEYGHALESFPDDPYVLHRAAELARRLGDHEALRRHLDRLARLSPSAAERADAAYQMGLVAQQILGDEAAAERDFARALEADPTLVPALAALGRLDLRRGRIEPIQDRYADEIRTLEEALRKPQAAAERRRTISALVDRYYRLARLLEESGDAAVALDVYKRALAVEPRFLPAFEAMDRLYTRHGRWRERAALILGWVQRQKGAPLDAIGPLLTAADILRVHLDDPANAARLAARTLALAPDHPYALRRASETFAALGNTAARVEVDLRWGRLEGDPRAPARLLRAAQLQELDGDSLAAAAEALPLYREALARDPESAAAIDGLLRTALRLGRTGELVQQIEAHDLAAHPAPLIALPIAEALLAAGRPDETAAFLIRWRARARAAGTLDRRADAASLALLALACERTDHWRALADTLEEQAALAEGRARAVLLARAGALWALRLGDPALAGDAWRRALDADPACAAARAGLDRLAAVERGDWRPAGPVAEAVARAREAEVAGDAAARSAALDEVAARARDPRAAVAWRVLARGDDAPLEAAGALYAAHPERGDLFAAYRRRLEDAGDTPGLVAALWLRLDYEDEPGKVALLSSLIGHALRIDDRASVREAADALLEIDPGSLPALLARRRLGRLEDDPAASTEAGRQLTGVLRAPGPAAEVHHAAALEAEARGEAPARVQRLLTQAVELNPADAPAAAALAARLQAAGDWSRLAELHRRRLAALADPPTRRAVARDLARLLADRLDDLPEAWRTLHRELSAEAPDPETALLGAEVAERLGRTGDADTCFALAARADGGRMRLEAGRAQAAVRHRRGDIAGARALLQKVVAAAPDDVESLRLMAELLAAERQWKGVVQIFRRLMALEPTPAAQADRAVAIGEVFARVYRDPRRAAGWFKRAIELDPARLAAVWRLLEEAEKAPEGAVPVEHVADAVDRAIDARRAALVDDPADPAALDALARLHARRGDRDGQLLVGEALCWTGHADARTRRWVEAARGRVSLDFARPLSDELRRTLLEDPAERGRDREVFDAFALVLTEVLAGAMPPAAPRLSRRSFPEWQAEFRRLAAGLGVDDVELYNGGRAITRFRGLYLPHPAIAAPGAALSGPLDGAQAFAVGQLLDGLRDGRLLLESPGVDRVARCAAVMAATLSPGLLPPPAPDAVPAEIRDRLVERARRLPRRIKLQLDGLAARGGEPIDLARLAGAVAITRDRAGLICCGDLRVALDGLVFPDAAAAEQARRAGGALAALDASPAGRRLLVWALGPQHGRLRRVLGLGLSGRPA